MWHLSRYSPIQQREESQESLLQEEKDAKTSLKLYCGTLWTYLIRLNILGTTFALLIFLVFFLIAYLATHFDHRTHYDCGQSPEEARAKDCQFDMLAFAWVPLPCFDAELSATYDPYHEFEFFYDDKHEHQIPVEELKRGINHRVFTNGRYHRTHCVYAWKTLQNAVREGFQLSDNKTLSPDHYNHCSYYLVDIDDSYLARFQMDFVHCERMSYGGLLW